MAAAEYGGCQHLTPLSQRAGNASAKLVSGTMVGPRMLFLVMSFTLFVCDSGAQNQTFPNAWAAADAKLEMLYKRSLGVLPPKDQESLREAERAWITFTQKNGSSIVSLRDAGVFDAGYADSLFLAEQQNRCDQLQTFFVQGLFREEDSKAAKEQADIAIQVTYDKCLSSLSKDDQYLLREAQRSWLAYRDADADSTVLAARNSNRPAFRGYAAKIRLTNARNVQLRSIYLARKNPGIEQTRAFVPVNPPIQSNLREEENAKAIAQVKDQAKSFLSSFLKKEAAFFKKATSLKELPSLDPEVVAKASELDAQFTGKSRSYSTVALLDSVADEWTTVMLIQNWSSFGTRLKTGEVESAIKDIYTMLEREPKGGSPQYYEIWRVAGAWKSIIQAESSEFEAHVKKAKELSLLGKNSDAIREYEKAYGLIENVSIPPAIKKLREQSLGL